MLSVAYFAVAFTMHVRYKDNNGNAADKKMALEKGVRSDGDEKSRLILNDGEEGTTSEYNTPHEEPTLLEKVYWWFHSTTPLMSTVVVIVYWIQPPSITFDREVI